MKTLEKPPESEIILKHILNRIRKGLGVNALIVGPPGMGKTQPKGNKVLLANGNWKDVSEIQINDLVVSPQKDESYSFAKVVQTHQRFENEVYELYQQNRKNKTLYSCASNHIIPHITNFIPRVRDENGKVTNKRNHSRILVEKEAGELAKLKSMNAGESNKNSLFTTTPIEFTHPDQTINPYFLGAFLGDGTFIKSNFSICLGKKKQNIIEYLSKVITVRKKIEKKESPGTYHYYFNLDSSTANKLKELGLHNKKSGDKFIPKSCLLSSIKYRKNLLAALIDTDGYVSKENCIVYTSKSKRLTQDIHFLVHSLGGYCTQPKKIQKKCQNGFEGEYHSITISFEDPTKLLLKTDKIKRLRKRLVNPRHIKFKIKKAKPQMVYGFELDSEETNSHWFITNNFVVTHNSYVCLRLAERIYLERFNEKILIKNHIVNDLPSAFKFVRNITRPGEPLVIEEVSVIASARRSMALENVSLNYLLDTVRKKQVVLLMNAPHIKAIDKHIQRMSHLLIECLRINKNFKFSTVKAFTLTNSQDTGKVYKHRFGDKGRDVHRSFFYPPSDYICKLYEDSKNEFMESLYKRMEEKTQAKLTGKKKVNVRPEVVNVTQKEAVVFGLLQSGHNKTQISQLLGITHGAVSFALKRYERKTQHNSELPGKPPFIAANP